MSDQPTPESEHPNNMWGSPETLALFAGYTAKLLSLDVYKGYIIALRLGVNEAAERPGVGYWADGKEAEAIAQGITSELPLFVAADPTYGDDGQPIEAEYVIVRVNPHTGQIFPPTGTWVATMFGDTITQHDSRFTEDQVKLLQQQSKAQTELGLEAWTGS